MNGLCSGGQGLKCVADMGAWNWVFIGPDPTSLPLVAGGENGITEMADCYEIFGQDDDNGNMFGLLRFDFARGRNSRTKFVFIRASRFGDSQKISVIKQSQLASLTGAMKRAISEYAHFAVALEFTCLADFSMDAIMARLLKASPQDQDFLTMAAMKQGQELHKERVKEAQKTGGVLPGWNKQRPTIIAGWKNQRPTLTIPPPPPDVGADVEQVMPPMPAAEDSVEEQIQPNQDPPVVAKDPPKEDPRQVAATEEPKPEDKNPEEHTPLKLNERPPDASPASTKPPSPSSSPSISPRSPTSPASAPAACTESEETTPAEEKKTPSTNGESPNASSTPTDQEKKPPAAKEPDYIVYEVGQVVMVYCPSRKYWFDDGIVIKRLQQGGIHDGMALKTDSVKVHYNGKKTYTWLLPCHFKEYLQPSERPRPPASGSGELYKQTHNWFSKNHVRYFDLSDGYLHWWPTLEDAKRGYKASGEIYLQDLEVMTEATKFCVRAKATKGLIYAFDATTEEGCLMWVKGLKRHGAYCNAMAEYFEAKGEPMEEKVAVIND